MMTNTHNPMLNLAKYLAVTTIVIGAAMTPMQASAASIKKEAEALLTEACKVKLPAKVCGPLAGVTVKAGDKIYNALKSGFSEFPRARFYRNKVHMKLVYLPRQKSRASMNFEFPHSRSGASIFRAELRGVEAEDRNRIRVTLLADKPRKRDGARSEAFGNGDRFRVKWRGKHDRALYVARLTWEHTPGLDKRADILLRNPNLEVVLHHERTISKAEYLRTPPVQCEDQVGVFEHPGFQGRALYNDRSVNLQDLRWKAFNDVTSSVCVPRGWQVDLYEHLSGRGRKLTVKGPRVFDNMPRGWNDRVTSMLISKTR